MFSGCRDLHHRRFPATRGPRSPPHHAGPRPPPEPPPTMPFRPSPRPRSPPPGDGRHAAIRTIWPACATVSRLASSRLKLRFAPSSSAKSSPPPSNVTVSSPSPRTNGRRTLTNAHRLPAAGTLTRRPAAFAARTDHHLPPALRRHFARCSRESALA